MFELKNFSGFLVFQLNDIFFVLSIPVYIVSDLISFYFIAVVQKQGYSRLSIYGYNPYLHPT